MFFSLDNYLYYIIMLYHMKKIYTYEYCENYVKDFESISSLKEKNPSILVVIRRNGWGGLLDGLERKIHKKYTLEECTKKVSEYDFLSDFMKENASMYSVILQNGWKRILKDLKRAGSKYKRCIYAYEFFVGDEKYAYIGLTFNLDVRDIGHKTDKNSAVYRFAKENNIAIPNPIRLTEYVDKQEASKLEGEYLKIYKEKRWNILNRAKTGNLGGKETMVTYTKEYCISLAKKYDLVTRFGEENSRAYLLIRKNGWEKEAFAHMKTYDHKKDNTINKKVYQFTLDGEKIGEYYSISEANRVTNVKNSGISKCCSGERKTAGGFKWSFKDNISTISVD